MLESSCHRLRHALPSPPLPLLNSGAADYVEPKEDLEQKVSAFFEKVSHPVLTDIALDMGGVETDLIYPRALPDIFKGSQLALIGRYRNETDLKNVRLRLTGTPRHGQLTPL